MTKKQIAPEITIRIRQELLKGEAQNKVAKKYKVSDGFVNKVAKQLFGNDNPHTNSQTKEMNQARKEYTRTDRLMILHKIMGKIDVMLDNPELKTGSLRDLTVSTGIVLDKYRLEEIDDSKERSGIDELMEVIHGESLKYTDHSNT